MTKAGMKKRGDGGEGEKLCHTFAVDVACCC